MITKTRNKNLPVLSKFTFSPKGEAASVCTGSTPPSATGADLWSQRAGVEDMTSIACGWEKIPFFHPVGRFHSRSSLLLWTDCLSWLECIKSVTITSFHPNHPSIHPSFWAWKLLHNDKAW